MFGAEREQVGRGVFSSLVLRFILDPRCATGNATPPLRRVPRFATGGWIPPLRDGVAFARRATRAVLSWEILSMSHPRIGLKNTRVQRYVLGYVFGHAGIAFAKRVASAGRPGAIWAAFWATFWAAGRGTRRCCNAKFSVAEVPHGVFFGTSKKRR